MDFEAFKRKEEEKPPALKRKLPEMVPDIEHIEIKRLSVADVEEATLVLRKCTVETNEDEVRGIIKEGLSYGAYVDRMLVGVGLAWVASYDPKKKALRGDHRNAAYVEEVVVLLQYEGKGIRNKILQAIENEAQAKGLSYTVALITPGVPESSESSVTHYGTKTEKVLVQRGYELNKTPEGILAVKDVTYSKEIK
ncbi:MAG: hypothetical protein QW035_01170 [Candidatus Anstonellales archaeon]